MKHLIEKHPRAIRWFHWINFPLLFLMIWSGLKIYWANDIYSVKIRTQVLFHFFPKYFYQTFLITHRLAEGMALHFMFMWPFLINGILYVLYTVISGEWKYIVPEKGSFKESWRVILHDLGISKAPLPQAKF